MANIINYEKVNFETIKHINEYGAEYWSSRELMPLLGYSKWQNFEMVIQKAAVSIANTQEDVNYWLTEVSKSISSGKNSRTVIKDYNLSRYACYVIAQNGDSKKPEIAAAQSYFAIQTRKQELREHKGLSKSQNILDHMGSTELAANLFRATQTDEKLRRENIYGKKAANDVHYQVGKKVRQTISELGGTMPEDLPTPEKSIKQLEKESKGLENK